MKFPIAPRQVVNAFAMAVLMAGCGGGGDMDSRVEAGGPAPMSAATTQAAPVAPTPQQVMDWAEVHFPQFFPSAGKLEGFAPTFVYRYYPGTQNYLAVSTELPDMGVYVYGQDTGWQLVRVGALSDFTCAVLPLNCVAGAAGTLIGHVVAATDFHGIASDHTQIIGPRNTVVGDGVELTNEFFSGFATVDLSGTSIRITAATDQPFGYFELLRFADANGTISPIASVTVDPATNYAGFNASRLNVTADSIDVNLTGLSGLQGQQILLHIAFAAP